MKGDFTGSASADFKINPPKTAISKLSAGSKSFRVTWRKKLAQVTGYQIEYSLKKSFANSKTATIKDKTTVSKLIKNLKAGKTYYVRIRTYKTVGSAEYYSAWSAAKSVKVKK